MWGNTSAPVMIIGEAPGSEEMRNREPFCGKSGKVLEQALKELEIVKSDICITNTVCYMPIKDGKLSNPTQEEIDNCKQHLVDEINTVSPKVIITLGAVATKAITGLELPISKMRGKCFPSLKVYKEIPVYPSWHPSYIVRGKSNLFHQLLSDLKQAFVFSGLLHSNTIFKKTKILLDLNDIFSYITSVLESRSLLSFDLETTGGSVLDTSIIGISFCYTDEEAVYIPLLRRNVLGELEKYQNYDEIVSLLKQLLESEINPKTAFNSKYDEQVLYHNLGIKVRRISIDPMLAYYLTHEEDKLPSLEFMEDLYFPGVEKSKSMVKNMGLKDYSLLDLDTLAEYSAEDALYTRKLAHIMRAELEAIKGWGVNGR